MSNEHIILIIQGLTFILFILTLLFNIFALYHLKQADRNLSKLQTYLGTKQ